MPIELDDALRNTLRTRLTAACNEELDLDLELGLVRSTKLLDVVLETVGATIYNRALADAQAYLSAKLIDMEIDLGEPARGG